MTSYIIRAGTLLFGSFFSGPIASSNAFFLVAADFFFVAGFFMADFLMADFLMADFLMADLLMADFLMADFITAEFLTADFLVTNLVFGISSMSRLGFFRALPACDLVIAISKSKAHIIWTGISDEVLVSERGVSCAKPHFLYVLVNGSTRLPNGIVYSPCHLSKKDYGRLC